MVRHQRDSNLFSSRIVLRILFLEPLDRIIERGRFSLRSSLTFDSVSTIEVRLQASASVVEFSAKYPTLRDEPVNKGSSPTRICPQ
jgi:hypothetical protein